MAKYDKMNEANQQESERKIQLAVAEIHRTVSEGKPISVSELSRNTGLSKGFFYKISYPNMEQGFECVLCA